MSELFYDIHNQPHQKPENVIATVRVAAYAMVMKRFDDGLRALFVVPVWHNKLDLPGGEVDFAKGETTCEAAIRECLEETGYRIGVATQPAYVDQSYFCNTLGKEKTYRYSLKLYYIGWLKHDLPLFDPVSKEEEKETREVKWMPLYEGVTQKSVHHNSWNFVSMIQERERFK